MKRLFAILLALVMVLSLAACGGNKEPDVPERTLADVVGIWEIVDREDHSGAEAYVLYFDDWSWESIDLQGNQVAWGVYAVEDNAVVYKSEGWIMTWDDYGNLCDEDGNVELRYLCGFEGQEYEDFLTNLTSNWAHFDKMGYEINYAFGDGEVYMENGAFVMANGGQYFERMPTTVSMELDSFNDTGDGFVEIEFTQTVWLASENFPEFIYDVDYYENGLNSGLYDYYTGYNLPASSTYGDTERGDNYYYFEFESQGQTICVDYNYSTEWIKDGTGSKAFVKQVFIRMPADYDGIVYGVLEGYPDFVTYALNNSGEEETIGPMDDINKDNAIFCRVNTL